MNKARHILAVLMLFILMPHIAVANMDAMQLRQLDHYQPALRWDNIESEPDWIAGVKPRSNKNWGLHSVVLTANNSTHFRLASYQSIRLYNPVQQLNADDVSVRLDNGSGLAVDHKVYASTDGHSLIIAPQSNSHLIVHIQSTRSELELGLFVSRYQALNTISPYKTLLSISPKNSRIASENSLDSEHFWKFEALLAQTIRVSGPARLQLQNRLIYQADDRKLNQQYRIQYHFDNEAPEWLSFSTTAESRQKLFIDDNHIILGRKESGYIEIPAGKHQLSLQTERPVYLRLLLQTEQDYLFPKLNQPRVSVQSIRAQSLLSSTPLIKIGQSARKISNDNRYQDGGMVGNQLLKQAVLQRHDYPHAQNVASQLRGQSSFYRDVFPSIKSTTSAPFNGFFITKKLRNIHSTDLPAYLAKQHISDSLNRAANALFTEVSASPTYYELPKRYSPSQIRLLIDKRDCHEQQLFIKQDDKPAVAIQLFCQQLVNNTDFDNNLFTSAIKQFQDPNTPHPTSTMKKTPYSHSLGNLISIKPEVCSKRVILAKASPGHYCTNPDIQDSTSYSLIANHFDSGPLIPVAHYEINIAPRVKTIQVWQHDHQPPPINIALQYRASKKAALSEKSYKSLVQLLSKSYLRHLFLQGLSSTDLAPQSLNENEKIVQNEWHDLSRQILSASRLYTSGINKQAMNKRTYPLGDNNWVAKAKQAEQQENGLPAIENWGQHLYQQQGEQRQIAQFAQAQLLQKLNEPYLADRLYRYLSLYGSPSMAKQAYEKLKENHLDHTDFISLQRLASAMLVRWQTKDYLEELFLAYNKNGKFKNVLLIGKTFLEQPPEALMLAASYQSESWIEYHDYLMLLPKQQQSFWLGLYAQRQGDYSAALNYWKNDNTSRWHESLTRGLRLRQQLQHACGQQRNELQQQWLSWQQQLPGEKAWTHSTKYIKDYSSSDNLLSEERAFYSLHFNANTERPLKLAVLGETTLRFQIRITAKQQQNEIKDSWITVIDNGIEKSYPINHKQVAQGLKSTHDQAQEFSPLITIDYHVGKGMHAIELFSKQENLSISIQEQKIKFPLTVLPHLQSHTFQAITQLASLPMLTSEQLELVDLDSGLMMQPNTTQCQVEHAEFDDKYNDTIAKTKSTSNLAELNSHNVNTLINLEAPTSQHAAEKRMIHYVWFIEQKPEQLQALLFHAKQLLKQYNNSALIHALWQRIARHTKWKEVKAITDSAGIKFIELEGWQPESPFVRTRKALLPPSPKNEHVIFSDQRLLFSLNTFRKVTLSVDVKLEDIPYLSEAEAQLSWSIDDGDVQQVNLKQSDSWQRLTLSLAAGEHQLRFYQSAALSNQYIKLRFDDKASDLDVNQQRRYFISTKAEPVSLYVKGPTIIRIDELNDSNFISSYQEVAKGWQKVVIKPTANQQQRLVRIKQLHARYSDQKSNTRITQRVIVTVPEPLITVAIPKAIDQVELFDEFELGKQEDGTWSTGMDWVSRNNVQEDGSSDLAEPERFAQFRLNHRYFGKHYWNTGLFLRKRENGTPTLGLKESVYINPDLLPFSLQLDAKAIVQNVNGNPYWLAELRTRISQSFHITPKTTLIPDSTLFARYLSLNESDIDKNRSLDAKANQRAISKIDQDIYSPYKEDHPHGMKVGLTLIHTPWLDTVWSTKLSSASNENMNVLNPDNIVAEAHWKQMLGQVSLDASYRLTYYQTDHDRFNNTRRRKLGLDINWHKWLNPKALFELDFNYAYDQERHDHSGMLSLTMHFSEGRYYRDFKSSSIDFRTLRERQVPDQANNRIQW